MTDETFPGPEDLDAEIRDRRDRLLAAALPHVPFDGWTRRALDAGARDEGLTAADVAFAFPLGPGELVAHFGDWADRAMLAAVDAETVAALKVRERITRLVRVRLEVLAPHKEAVRRAAAFLAVPVNAPAGARSVARTADRIWAAAGDTATDLNWYSKRALLIGVLGSTTLYWLNDTSEEHAQTWGVLDRRIADVLKVGSVLGRARSVPGSRIIAALPSPARFVRQFRSRRRAT
jgi:ubiquinone biosynthesis protein COQ9